MDALTLLQEAADRQAYLVDAEPVRQSEPTRERWGPDEDSHLVAALRLQREERVAENRIRGDGTFEPNWTAAALYISRQTNSAQRGFHSVRSRFNRIVRGECRTSTIQGEALALCVNNQQTMTSNKRPAMDPTNEQDANEQDANERPAERPAKVTRHEKRVIWAGWIERPGYALILTDGAE